MQSRIGVLASMRSHLLVRLLAVAAGPLFLGGCYREVAWRVPAPVVSEPLILDYRGDSIQLSRAVLEGDSVLTGWRYQVAGAATVVAGGRARTETRTADSLFVRLPLQGVEREIRPGPTIALVFVGALLGMALVVTSDPCFPMC